MAQEESGMSAMDGMGDSSAHASTGMATTFFTSTSTPLYSSSWKPQNAGQYAGTCLFLIVLAIVLRALFTARTWVDMKAVERARKRRYIVVAGDPSVTEAAMDEASSTAGILTANGVEEKVRVVSAPVQTIQPWRFGVDLPRALLTTTAVAVGYLLMLAVMTFNLGYFLSVLAGAFIGEVAFGRYQHGAMSM